MLDMRFLFAIPLQVDPSQLSPAASGGGLRVGSTGLLILIVLIILALVYFVKRNRRFSQRQDRPISYPNKEADSFKVAEDGTIIRAGGGKRCPKCNKSYPLDARFCSDCGVKLK